MAILYICSRKKQALDLNINDLFITDNDFSIDSNKNTAYYGNKNVSDLYRLFDNVIDLDKAGPLKTYDKEKLHEYAKELFALCLEKGIAIKIRNSESIYVKYFGFTVISEKGYDFKCSSKYHGNFMPIWELIEKVKAL